MEYKVFQWNNGFKMLVFGIMGLKMEYLVKKIKDLEN